MPCTWPPCRLALSLDGAEMLALAYVLELLQTLPDKYSPIIVCTDSMSALVTLRTGAWRRIHRWASAYGER